MIPDWSADQRPRWRARVVYRLLHAEQGARGRPGALRLENALVATGTSRAPRVDFAPGEVHVSVLVKADDPAGVQAACLSAVESGTRQVGGLLLGEALFRSATPAPALVTSGR